MYSELLSSSLFFSLFVALPDLPFFPTRRSSDLSVRRRSVYRARDQDFPKTLRQRHRRFLRLWRHGRKCTRSEEHTSELQSPCNLVCRLLLEKKNNKY